MSLFCKLQDETNSGHVTVLSGSPERCHVIDNLSARHVARACHLAVVVFLHYEGRRLDVRRRRLRHDLGWRPRRVQLRRLRRRDVGVARHVGDLWHRRRRDGRAQLLRPGVGAPGGGIGTSSPAAPRTPAACRCSGAPPATGPFPAPRPAASRRTGRRRRRAARSATCGRCRQERAAAAAAAPRSRATASSSPPLPPRSGG